jgi:hypothetical protein
MARTLLLVAQHRRKSKSGKRQRKPSKLNTNLKNQIVQRGTSNQ